ncbi:hypothetical protein QQZ08_002737 [Neonectria magnoliae]|uniref:Uncharacterized protein n=1 Tax=Neonectria magnoliae TaxID=2732573 RepID=A0ABR1IAR0_9HYPO
MRHVGQNPYWIAAVRDFPVFAERHEEAKPASSGAVRDTGLTQIAYAHDAGERNIIQKLIDFGWIQYRSSCEAKSKSRTTSRNRTAGQTSLSSIITLSARMSRTYFTLIGRMTYCDMLAYFDIGDRAMISWFRSAQFPKTSWGLSAVIGPLVVHLVLVAFISFVFLTGTEVSRVGDNAWQCLTQANYGEMRDEFWGLTHKEDGDVKKLLKAEGLDGAVHVGALEEYLKRKVELKRVG